MRKKTKINFNYSYILDLFFLIVLAIISIFESIDLKKIINYEQFNNNEVSLITILLPLVITIISISLSFSKEKIFGKTINDINLLRKKFYFNFLHIGIINCLIFLINFIFDIYKLKISNIVLILITFIYSLIFLIQEVPLLMKSKTLIKLILKEKSKNINSSNKFYSQKEEIIFKDLINNIILTEGINTAFKMIYVKENASKNHLLLIEFQNEYFNDLIENYQIYKNNEEIKIYDFIKIGYGNAIEILSMNNFLYFINSDKYYLITDLIINLHDASEISNYDDSKEINNFIRFYFENIILKGNNILLEKVILSLCKKTILDNKFWFINAVSNFTNNVIYNIFNFEGSYIGFFICIFLSYKMDVENTKFEEKLVSPYKIYLNRYSIIIKRKEPFKLINILLDKYRLIYNNDFIEKDLRKYIVYAGIELMFYLECSSENEIDKSLKKLEVQDQNLIFEVLQRYYIVNGEFNVNSKYSFLQNMLCEVNDYLYENKGLTNSLLKFYKNHCIIKQCQINDEDIKNLTKKVENSFNQSVQNCLFYDRSLSLEGSQIRYFKPIILKNNYIKFIDEYLKSLYDSLLFLNNDMINEKCNIIYREKHELNEKEVNKIIELNPDFSTENFYHLIKDKNLLSMIENYNIKNVNNFVPGLYYKNDAIKFNAELLKDKAQIRRLNNNEVEYYIQTNYSQLQSGLYRYNDGKNIYLIKKEELEEIIKKDVIIVLIVFKYKIVIEKEQCIKFINKK